MASVQPVATAKPKKHKEIYCADVVPVGSHITVRKCQTLDEWQWDAYKGAVEAQQAITLRRDPI